MIVLAGNPLDVYLALKGQTRFLPVPYRVLDRSAVHLKCKSRQNQFRPYDAMVARYVPLWRGALSNAGLVHPVDFGQALAFAHVVALIDHIHTLERADAELEMTELERQIVELAAPKAAWLMRLEGIHVLETPFKVGIQHARVLSEFDDTTLKERKYLPMPPQDVARFYALLTSLEAAKGDKERRNALCATHFVCVHRRRYATERKGILGLWNGAWTLRMGWRTVFHKRYPKFKMSRSLDAAPEKTRHRPKTRSGKGNITNRAKQVKSIPTKQQVWMPINEYKKKKAAEDDEK